MITITKNGVADTASRRGRFGGGLGGAVSRRHALQAVASVWAGRKAMGQSRARTRKSFKTGLTVVGDTEGKVGAVHSLTLQASDGRQRSGGREFALGDTVEICFGTSRKGFVSLWSQDAYGKLDRLVPNRYTPDGSEGVPVGEGRTYCVGSDGRLTTGDGATVAAGTGQYRLEVQEPVGPSELLLYWTTEPEQQPEGELAMDIDALDEAIEKARGGSGKHRGPPPLRESLTFGFEIVRGPSL